MTSPAQEGVSSTSNPVRVDKWLWATRSYKTRSVASKACSSGNVRINGSIAKASQKVRVGDEVRALTTGGLRILIVVSFAEKRGPYSFAKTLYEDKTPPPVKEIAPPRLVRGGGRPTKKDRRNYNKLSGR
jgi:ribosome-associated heat shock protein Hsp15